MDGSRTRALAGRNLGQVQMPSGTNQPHNNLTLEDLSAFVGFGNAVQAIRKARARLRSVDEVLDRLEQRPVVPYGERRLVLLPLQEATLAPAQVTRLEMLVDGWGARAEASSSSRDGDRLYGLMRSVLELLPRQSRVSRCLDYLNHRHVHRRLIACGLLRSEDLSLDQVKAICKAAELRPHRIVLELAARHSTKLIPEDAVRVVLPQLQEPYWQARVIEGIIDRTPQRTRSSLAQAYPMAVLWAAARLRRSDLFALTVPHLPFLEERPDQLPIVAWALGRMRRPVELGELESKMRRHALWERYRELHED